MPSNTISGSVPALIDPSPRIKMDEVDPGAVEGAICKPGTSPAKVCNTLVTCFFSIVALFNTVAEPVNADFLAVPKAVTITSSNSSEVDVNTMRIRSFAFTSCVCKPTKETTSTSEARTSFKWNLPSMSVIIPLLVPFTKIEAPITGSDCSSTTVPVMLKDCAHAGQSVTQRRKRSKPNLIFMSLCFMRKNVFYG